MRLADAVRASTESMPYPSPEMGHPVSPFISIYMFPTGSEKAGLKPNIQKTKIIASSPIILRQTEEEQWKQ